MQGNDRVKFLLAVQYHYKVIFQATRIHFIANLPIIKTLYNNNNVLFSLQQRDPGDFGLFTVLCYNHSPRLDNFLLGTSNCSVQFFYISKTTVPGQLFSWRSHNSNQQGMWEMKDEVRASVGDHNVISNFVPSDLDDIQFHWETKNVEMDAVYRPCIDTHFSLLLFENFPVAGSADYPIELDVEQDKENEYHTTPESQRPMQPPLLHRSLSLDLGHDWKIYQTLCIVVCLNSCILRKQLTFLLFTISFQIGRFV